MASLLSPRRSSPEHPPRSSNALDSEIVKMKDKLVTIVERFLCNLIPEEKRETVKFESASFFSLICRGFEGIAPWVKNEMETLYISSLVCFYLASRAEDCSIIGWKYVLNLAGIDKYYFLTWALQAMNVGVVGQGNLTNVYQELFNAVHLSTAYWRSSTSTPSAGGPLAAPADEATPAPPAN